MKTIVLALALMFAVGSSTVLASTRSDYTKSFPLRTLKTFAFKDQHRISRDPLANNDIWGGDIRDTIRKDLAGHGYVEAVNGRPDFYVAFYVGLQDRYDVNAIGYGLPVIHRRGWWGWPGGYDVWSVPYTESTLIIDVIDAKTNQLVWRGYDTDTLNSGNPEKTLDSAVDHIVSRLAHDTGKHADT
jgi:cytolysin (calcineurin-like family phosphatase)